MNTTPEPILLRSATIIAHAAESEAVSVVLVYYISPVPNSRSNRPRPALASTIRSEPLSKTSRLFTGPPSQRQILDSHCTQLGQISFAAHTIPTHCSQIIRRRAHSVFLRTKSPYPQSSPQPYSSFKQFLFCYCGFSAEKRWIHSILR